MDINPLEYFDEEYSNIQQLIEDTNALVLQSKSIISIFPSFKKDLENIINSEFNLTTFNYLVVFLQSVLSHINDLTSNLETLTKTLNKQRY